jgi:farnesyl-diphosphate farnesyltransferase
LPEQELRAHGIAPSELISRYAEVGPVLDKWRQKAGREIAAGMDYCCAIGPARVRFATALPALIGARTLALLREAGTEALRQKIKVPRSEVRSIMSGTSLTLASPNSLRRKFKRLSQ